VSESCCAAPSAALRNVLSAALLESFFDLFHETVQRAAPQFAFDANPPPALDEPLLVRVLGEPLVEDRFGLLVPLLLPQQLHDAEPQLRVVRLARQLMDQGVDRLERVALLLVQVGDVLPCGGVEGVALRGALIRRDQAVQWHVLRLVHGGDADVRRREVRLDGQRLVGGVQRLRELALLALVVAFARLLGRTHEVVEALRDRLAHGQRGAGIADGHREQRRQARAADVAHADRRRDGAAAVLERPARVRIHREEAAQLVRLRLVEQHVARVVRRLESLAQLRLGNDLDLVPRHLAEFLTRHVHHRDAERESAGDFTVSGKMSSFSVGCCGW